MKNKLLGKNIGAYDLLEFLKTNCPKFTYKVPIDVRQIIKCLNIELKEVMQFNDLLGEIEVKNGEPIITINKFNNEYSEREKFTIAHELGHLCQHITPNHKDKFIDTEETIKRSSNQWSFREYEANNFAARLLMPSDLLKEEILKILENHKESIDQSDLVEMLSNKFKVSKQAMYYRLKNLGLIK
jgi:Zn-dependent peptidase ImmA (M78 family)